jgi:hypothetical protein
MPSTTIQVEAAGNYQVLVHRLAGYKLMQPSCCRREVVENDDIESLAQREA